MNRNQNKSHYRLYYISIDNKDDRLIWLDNKDDGLIGLKNFYLSESSAASFIIRTKDLLLIVKVIAHSF